MIETVLEGLRSRDCGRGTAVAGLRSRDCGRGTAVAGLRSRITAPCKALILALLSIHKDCNGTELPTSSRGIFSQKGVECRGIPAEGCA